MLDKARRKSVSLPAEYTTPYINTIPVKQEPYFPGDEAMERQYHRWIRWNATVQVTHTQRPDAEVGGHISSYASVATLYEIDPNHFLRGKDRPGGDGHVSFRGYASPGPCARASLEGRLSEVEMDGFRQQASSEHGLPSYPHPRQPPNFWEYPTVSLGLGPAEAIYQAWFGRYLYLHGIKDTSQQHTWIFVGDGKMDEPKFRGMLQLITRQGPGNLTFVISYNLQHLDGPAHGSGKIIQELEVFFEGMGWDVIKIIRGRGRDQLFVPDKDDAFVNVTNETLDGDYQTFKANNGTYMREHFFGRNLRTKAMVQNWTDRQIQALQHGGHDYRRVYAAHKAATEHTGQPAVILVHTIKSYILRSHFVGCNMTHQMEKLTLEDTKQLYDRLQILILDTELERNPYMPSYYKPADGGPTLPYVKERREKLGDWVPERRDERSLKLSPLSARSLEDLSRGSGSLEIVTTMAPVRLPEDLFKNKQLGRYFAPIIPDEARTFGFDAIFPSAKIFSTHGQDYTAVDVEMMFSYKESEQGQVMHVGITGAGSAAALQIVGTAYTTHDPPMIPIRIFYSMFGFQCTGDQFWVTGDQLVRGFVIGATADRTILAGGGLQHVDGHSPVLASTNRAFIIYDPAYTYEICYIMEDDLAHMYGEDDGRDSNVMCYIIVYDKPVRQLVEPKNVGTEGIKRGIHRVEKHSNSGGMKAQLLASGVDVSWVCGAKRMLAEDQGVDATVWSVASWNELRRDGLEAGEYNFSHPEEASRTTYLTEKLSGCGGPFVTTSDFDTLMQDPIRQWMPGEYQVLGANGLGISGTHRVARRLCHIDAESPMVHISQTLVDQGWIDRFLVKQAIDRYELFNCQVAPVGDLPNED